MRTLNLKGMSWIMALAMMFTLAACGKEEGGADAISLINTLTGMKIDVNRRKFVLANKTGGLVIGTGDLSELALGWATYNGDHMSMYGVNASVPKTLVRHLVRYYADTCGDKALADVLYDVLDTPVSPELLPPEEFDRIVRPERMV